MTDNRDDGEHPQPVGLLGSYAPRYPVGRRGIVPDIEWKYLLLSEVGVADTCLEHCSLCRAEAKAAKDSEDTHEGFIVHISLSRNGHLFAHRQVIDRNYRTPWTPPKDEPDDDDDDDDDDDSPEDDE
jgi:hypothetical protein